MGLSKEHSKDVLKGYRKAARKFHPDRHVNSDRKIQYQTNRIFQELRNAHEAYKKRYHEKVQRDELIAQGHDFRKAFYEEHGVDVTSYSPAAEQRRTEKEFARDAGIDLAQLHKLQNAPESFELLTEE